MIYNLYLFYILYNNKLAPYNMIYNKAKEVIQYHVTYFGRPNIY